MIEQKLLKVVMKDLAEVGKLVKVQAENYGMVDARVMHSLLTKWEDILGTMVEGD